MYKVGYIKSTSKLEIEEQSEFLISKGCSKIYVETSKDFQSKEKLKDAIESLLKGDTLAVTRLSILCISVQSLLEIMYELKNKDVNLEVIQQNFNSKDNHSLDELLLYLIEFVEDIKVEKRIIGLKNGKRVGRPLKLTENQIFQAIKLKHSQSSKQVANKFGVARSTLLRHIAKQKRAS